MKNTEKILILYLEIIDNWQRELSSDEGSPHQRVLKQKVRATKPQYSHNKNFNNPPLSIQAEAPIEPRPEPKSEVQPIADSSLV